MVRGDATEDFDVTDGARATLVTVSFEVPMGTGPGFGDFVAEI